MDNLDEVLKEKTTHADNSEFFVFLPNDLNDSKSVTADKNLIFRDAFASKSAGNELFQKKKFDDAICYYTKAIEILGKMNKNSCVTELAICYQNRSAANAHKKNYSESISDASKAIELNEHYSKAYFRRSKTYCEQTKYYSALQDIMQACILERFKNTTFNNLVCDIVTQIDLDLPENQWRLAYDQMRAAELHCDHCLKEQLKFIEKCGVLNQLIVPIPKDQPATGYIRAMKGIKQLNITDIMDGCNEEETTNGKYLDQAYILKAYMDTTVMTSPSLSFRTWPLHMQRLNKILDRKAPVPEDIRFNAKLCRANLYNRTGQYREATCDLNSLKDQYDKTGQFHVIKSGAFFQFALSQDEFLEALKECCKVLPNVYELQFQQIQAQSKRFNNKSLGTSYLLVKLEQLIKRFPAEISPRMFLAGLLIKLDDRTRAKKILKNAEKDLPSRKEEICSLFGMLRPTHACCVTYFKRSLKFNKQDPGSLQGLLNYYGSTTFEYAKAIEVATKALFSFLQENDFKDMFEYRLALLKRIIRQGFWDKL